ncbi:unnamed protein product [Sphenostylis stenocarpa]|uniref:DUF4220 domain-containing protein n=1 Tax=Sphenostylis stenocarpa TaxID=92480 RepID=A0AA86SQL9_9FABA|nr:unnamed protein product [Sphenostylis stenocarpa]
MIQLPSTWISIEGHRRLAQIIPDHVQEWWDKWEIRGLILISLLTQIVLTLLGDRTKYKPNMWIRAILWSAYLLADWVAAVAMGVISSSLGDFYNKGEQPKNANPQLLAFWAPFFLLHLGGPDSITAYALEDNELWLRHFVGLYGERAWSLYCGSIKHLRDSFLNSLDSSRKSELWQESRNSGVGELRSCLGTIYIFISLFVDLVLSPLDNTRDKQKLQNEAIYDCIKPFTWVKIELEILYDVFYTKAFANYGVLGFITRLLTLSATIVVLVLYANLSEKKEHQIMDHIITYLLLVGALIMEIYSFILVSISRWTTIYFSMKGLGQICMPLSCLHFRLYALRFTQRTSLAQSNFFHLICSKSLKMKGDQLPTNKLESTPKCVGSCLTSHYLLETIFRNLLDKSYTQSNPSGAPGYRNLLLENKDPIFSSELEFHRTIITWHIATDLLYYSTHDSCSEVDRRKNNCKEMSDYMFYLLVKQRHMLPVGAGLITLRDTVIEAMEYFEHVKVPPQQSNLSETCKVLLRHDTATAGARDDEVRRCKVYQF